ncbi:MAPEG family protein [Antarcticirhabdus aurantiaca]|uniref:MAPEG family protein n=1 Tax=Antarcticirhabdus aurantiaca TaxID=2606717 RepID=A0ACD4NPR7_9HYPH|nr:MAPEG family protein [Antarcticirhabdus aurantiaca]WAJ28681.1 MAPEG family protein [Jeongeuplla avenae]
MPEMTDMPTELVLLAWSVVLLLVHIGIQGFTATRERGSDWNAGPRDGSPKPLGVTAGRAERALANFKETYPAFIAAVVAVVVSGRDGTLSEIGVWLWFVGRIVYLPLYLKGVPMVRSLVYMVSILGILLVLLDLL